MGFSRFFYCTCTCDKRWTMSIVNFHFFRGCIIISTWYTMALWVVLHSTFTRIAWKYYYIRIDKSLFCCHILFANAIDYHCQLSSKTICSIIEISIRITIYNSQNEIFLKFDCFSPLFFLSLSHFRQFKCDTKGTSLQFAALVVDIGAIITAFTNI